MTNERNINKIIISSSNYKVKVLLLKTELKYIDKKFFSVLTVTFETKKENFNRYPTLQKIVEKYQKFDCRKLNINKGS